MIKESGKCSEPHCKQDSEIIHVPLNKEFCWKHWQKFCLDKDKVEKPKEVPKPESISGARVILKELEDRNHFAKLVDEQLPNEKPEPETPEEVNDSKVQTIFDFPDKII